MSSTDTTETPTSEATAPEATAPEATSPEATSPEASTSEAPEATAPEGDALESQRKANEDATAAHAEEQGHKGVTPWGDLPLDPDGMPRAEDLRTALKAVIDPEIGYSIVDLGLVYEVTKDEDGGVKVLMTLTSMGCPLTEVIHQQCSVILGSMPGVESVDVEFTFNPPWHTSMIEPWCAEELRAMGMNV